MREVGPSKRSGEIDRDWERLVRATRFWSPPNLLDIMFDIIRATDEIQDEDTIRIMYEQAYLMARNLDPDSDGRAVLQLRTGTMSVLKQKACIKEGATEIDRSRDIEYLWKFYEGYKRRKSMDPSRESRKDGLHILKSMLGDEVLEATQFARYPSNSR